MSQFQTDKDDITKTRLMDVENKVEDFTLTDDEILVAIERFSFTANNVTYGAVGHDIGYWQFFPPHIQASDAPNWGIVPVWGFAHVVATRNKAIKEGERIYGYFPIANFLRMLPVRIAGDRFADGAAHRTQLPAVYNNYERVGAVNPKNDNLRALLNPLYGTSFCLCDALEEEKFHAAQQVIILSASSKTAVGLAYGLNQLKGGRPAIIGLTSPDNCAFVAKTGVYDIIIDYDGLSRLDASRPAVLVDMAGNRSILSKVHAALGDNMRWCHNVGLTHWDDNQNDTAADKRIRERSAMFFAPGHIQRRASEWGAAEFNRRVAAFLADGMMHARDWMQVTEINGLENFQDIYDKMLAGNVTPQEGIIIKPV